MLSVFTSTLVSVSLIWIWCWLSITHDQSFPTTGGLENEIQIQILQCLRMNFSNTEESFVLSSLKEFVKAWGSGNHAYFNLECKNGSACIQLSFNLGHPGETHHHGPHQPHFQTQHQKKSCGPARQKRNNERAKAHQAKLAAASATLSTPSLPSPPPAASASPSRPTSPAMSVNIAAEPAVTIALSPVSNVCSLPPVVPTACVEETIPPPVLGKPGTEVENDDREKDDAIAINACGTDSVPVYNPSEVVPVFAIAAFENGSRRKVRAEKSLNCRKTCTFFLLKFFPPHFFWFIWKQRCYSNDRPLILKLVPNDSVEIDKENQVECYSSQD